MSLYLIINYVYRQVIRLWHTQEHIYKCLDEGRTWSKRDCFIAATCLRGWLLSIGTLEEYIYIYIGGGSSYCSWRLMRWECMIWKVGEKRVFIAEKRYVRCLGTKQREARDKKLHFFFFYHWGLGMLGNWNVACILFRTFDNEIVCQGKRGTS